MTARAAASQDALPAAWAVGWLRASRAGLVMIALVIGAGSGLGAVVFRYLIGLILNVGDRVSLLTPVPGTATSRSQEGA